MTERRGPAHLRTLALGWSRAVRLAPVARRSPAWERSCGRCWMRRARPAAPETLRTAIGIVFLRSVRPFVFAPLCSQPGRRRPAREGRHRQRPRHASRHQVRQMAGASARALCAKAPPFVHLPRAAARALRAALRAGISFLSMRSARLRRARRRSGQREVASFGWTKNVRRCRSAPFFHRVGLNYVSCSPLPRLRLRPVGLPAAGCLRCPPSPRAGRPPRRRPGRDRGKARREEEVMRSCGCESAG